MTTKLTNLHRCYVLLQKQPQLWGREKETSLDLVIYHSVYEETYNCLQLYNSLILFGSGQKEDMTDLNMHIQAKHISMLNMDVLMCR